jgi:hypothetical protein
MIRGACGNERSRQMFRADGALRRRRAADEQNSRACVSPEGFMHLAPGSAHPTRRGGEAEEERMNHEVFGLLGISTGIDTVREVSRAVQRSAETLEPEVPQLAGLVREAAETVERLSTDLRERSLGEIAASIADFARREPVAFFGSAVLAGFVLARLAQRASSGDERAVAHARLR